jgi:ATP-dependent DNA helicase RecQ
MAEGVLDPGDRYSWSEVRAAAARRFGVTRFRPGQRELIEAALAGRDSLGVLPTGAGKSLCYQLPALFLKGVVVVVSPLLALARDQLERLEAADVEAARLDSTIGQRDARRTHAELREGAHDVVLVTPERLQLPETVALLKARGVALVVVDEAHCVSQWGQDFRPAYLGLRAAIHALGRPAVMALTATAPPELARDMLDQLGIPDASVVQTGIERPNLRFELRRTVNREDKERALLALLDEEPGAGIVYAATTRRVAELHEWLRGRGVDAVRYHGQLRLAEREDAQRRFMHGDARLVVATNAFGLGIDKPDVRFVAHWHFPESVEAYYQEAGRAGRDGAPARAVLFYRLEDRRIRNAFLGGRHPRREEAQAVLQALQRIDAEGGQPTLAELARVGGLGENRTAVIVAALERLEVVVRRRARLRLRRPLQGDALDDFYATFEERQQADRDRLAAMVGYCTTVRCRVQYLREYFSEPSADPCGDCDRCREPSIAAEPARPKPPAPHELEVLEPHRPRFAVGERVRHAKFGAGRVLDVVAERVTVAFADAERTVLQRFLGADAHPGVA